jgi:ribosomal protein S12 methylthiotransferase accessory factor
MASQIVLKDSFKSYTYDQDKVLSPEQTVDMVKQRFANANLDILKHTVRIDSGRLDIPVFISICGGDAFRTIGTKKQMGKGVIPKQAEASALMELAERYSFFSYLKNRRFLRGTYTDLDHPVMDLENIQRSVHHDPQDADRAATVFKRVPLSWTWARNLTRQEDMLVPLSWFYEINQFNGPSAGNTIEEAIVQGTCEVVERHVSDLVSSKKVITPHVDLDSVQNEAARQLIAKLKRAGIRLWVKDLTLGMGIPSIGALAWDPSTFPHRSEIVFTAGTATDPEKALIRALTEVAQLAGDFDTGGSYVASGLPKPKNLDEVIYIINDYKKIPIQSLPSVANSNFKVEINNCLDALRMKGLELYVVNITHPILRIPATYNIVPGCRFRERARGSSVPFFASKIISHTLPPERALHDLNWMSSLYPDCYYLEFYKGLMAMEMHSYDRAFQLFRRALGLDPEAEDIPTIQCHIGLCYKDLGEFSRAIAELEKAAILDGERKEVHSALGYCYFKLNRHLESIDCFQKAIEIDPNSAIDYANIGSNLRELGRVDEAIRLYKMALELDSSIEFARENIRLLAEKPETRRI